MAMAFSFASAMIAGSGWRPQVISTALMSLVAATEMTLRWVWMVTQSMPGCACARTSLSKSEM